MVRLTLLANSLELFRAGLVLAVIIWVATSPGDDYSCAPVDSDEEGEDVPDDPDRWSDYDRADEAGVL